MKLDKELLTKHAKRLQAILNEKSTFAPYIARADFSKVLENSLNTLNAAEKKLTNVELTSKLSAKNLVKDFNKLGKNTFKLDDKFKYDDEGDLIDNINYLATYCNNIFKVNLDALVEGKNVVASNPTIDLKSKPEPEDMAGAGFAGMGMGMEGAAYGNPFVMGKAYGQVKADIATGKIYTYKSKPRIIPWVKWAVVGTIGLAIIALIISAVFAFMSANLQILYHISQSETKVDGLKFNATGPGIMYILVGLFGAYPIYQQIKGLIGKNENDKYYFNWPWVLIFVLMLLIFVMPDMRVTWLLSNEIKSDVGSSVWNAFQNWKIMYIVTLGCGGLCLIPMIIGAVCNPKQDKELIERKLKEYADQTMASGGFGPVPPVAPTAKADVQKPVDVKKTDAPKSKSKSEDKKDKK